jgi:hypothetical protein
MSRFLLWIAGAALGGCSSPLDLAALVPPPAHREEAPVLDLVLVRLTADQRPPIERGRRRFQGASTIGTDTLREPAEVALLRVVARDLVASGCAREASLTAAAPSHQLDIALQRLSASYTEGIETLPFLLPTSTIEAGIRAEVVLTDRSGRVFLRRTYAAEESRQAAALEGLSSAAAAALARSIRQALDAMLPEIAQSLRSGVPHRLSP